MSNPKNMNLRTFNLKITKRIYPIRERRQQMDTISLSGAFKLSQYLAGPFKNNSDSMIIIFPIITIAQGAPSPLIAPKNEVTIKTIPNTMNTINKLHLAQGVGLQLPHS